MKKLLVILAFLFSIPLFSNAQQNIEAQKVRVTKNLKPPADTSIAPLYVGEIRTVNSEQAMYICISLTGQKWKRLSRVGGDTLILQNVGTGQQLSWSSAGGDTLKIKKIAVGPGLSISTGSDSTLTISLAGAQTYTPTLTNTTNIDASTAFTTYYYRIGNAVTVWGKVDIDATTGGGVTTTLGFSLPVASAITSGEQLAGAANHGAPSGEPIVIFGDAANDRASFQFKTGPTNNQTVYFSFSYIIL